MTFANVLTDIGGKGVNTDIPTVARETMKPPGHKGSRAIRCQPSKFPLTLFPLDSNQIRLDDSNAF